MKEKIFIVVISLLSTLYGHLCGMGEHLKILLFLMAVDLAWGVAASIMKKGKRSKKKYCSRELGMGFLRKGGYLTAVLIAHYIDKVSGLKFVCDMAILAFIITEMTSILEHIALTGARMPKVLIRALEVLREKNESDGEADNGKDA